MKIVTLYENTACREGLCAGHGLSLYIETPRHRVLFDAGPNGDLVQNAAVLGVDLESVDIFVLSHGHFDHGGGIRAFCEINSRAELVIHSDAFGNFYSKTHGPDLQYIGLDPELWELESRVVPTTEAVVIDDELTLFSDEPEVFPGALESSAALVMETPAGMVPDPFLHEQNLLVTAWGKSVLFAGCAHRGIVNILAGAKQRLGRMPDAVFGGFHFFELAPGAEGGALIDRTAEALLEGETVYYTGHCTGEYAYGRLKTVLGDRLRPMRGGVTVEI